MEWISVKDRLPDDEQEVMAIVKESRINKRCYICIFQERWSNRRNIFSILTPSMGYKMSVSDYVKVFVLPLRSVTHWMPLPPPPKA